MRMQANLASALAPCVPLTPLYEDLPTNACPKTRSIQRPSFARPLAGHPELQRRVPEPFIAATNQVATEQDFSWTRLVEPIGQGGTAAPSRAVRWMPNC